jgi:putative DNA primase/helicase
LSAGRKQPSEQSRELRSVSPPVEKVLDRLEDYKEHRGEFRARCPAHQGNSDNSLSVKPGDDGRALLVCYADCNLQEILDALGLSVVDLFDHSGSNNSPGKKATKKTDDEDKILATDYVPSGTYWEFTSSTGEVLYIQRHKREYYRKVSDGLWKKGLDGVTQVPYNLHGLVDGVCTSKNIYQLEGPKDVETAREKLGVVATTSGGVKTWRQEFKGFYTGADVVIVPDNDDEGRKYADTVAQSSLRSQTR